MKTMQNYSFTYIFLRFLVCIGLFFLFFCSCSPHKENPLLLRADSLMTEWPDSALTVLENMSSPQRFSSADRALYALLLTQARHKNYVTLDNDSLIKVAVDYYGDTKKSQRAAQSYFYWGATYREMGNLSFAVEQYLKAIQLAPLEDEFMAMVYDNLAECYEEEDLYDVARETYQKSYRLLHEDKDLYYPLRGIAHLFLLQNQLDSALCYFQKAFECASIAQDSSGMSMLYHDLATVYLEKKEYNRANEYVSKVLAMSHSKDLSGIYHLKGRIMLHLNQPDSARHYFKKNESELDVYGKAVYYDGLYQVEKKMGNWEAAVTNADAYMILYDSIQGLSNSRELDILMDNNHLEEHRRELSHHTKMVLGSLIIAFLLLVSISSFLLLWNDRKRKKRFIALQQELVQKRVEAMLLIKEKTLESDERIKRLAELREQQLPLCVSMFRTTDCYKKLQAMEKANLKQLKSMCASRKEITTIIHKNFIDVMSNLNECYPALTCDDLHYCILSLLHCSKIVITELMDVSLDALKTRKSRIKSKIGDELFAYIFVVDNQWDTE